MYYFYYYQILIAFNRFIDFGMVLLCLMSLSTIFQLHDDVAVSFVGQGTKGPGENHQPIASH